MWARFEKSDLRSRAYNAVPSFCASTPVRKKIPPSKFAHPCPPKSRMKKWRGFDRCAYAQ